MAGLAEIIYELKTEKGLSEELVKLVIEDFLKAAYRKRFSTDENAVVNFSDDNAEVALYAKRTIVEEISDPVCEILLSEAQKLEPECEIGDQILIEFKPEDFTRNEILVANQKALQRIREFEGDTLQSEFKTKQGEIVIGYCLRESNKNIIVDLGKVEGLLPRRFRSPKEVYQVGDRIKALVYSVERKGHLLEIVLSRTHTDFVKKIFELEVPELYDGTVEIEKIVREPGYRTKIAVRSNHSDIDPIGTCVGARGVRINNVMLELDNERIDILRYDSDPLTFIHNALSPAEVKQVIVIDYAKRNAFAIVEDDKFSIAIGKLGLNVRLANRLTDWNITVKTEKEFRNMDQNNAMVKAIFSDEKGAALEVKEDTEVVNISKVEELPGIQSTIVEKLRRTGVAYIEDLITISNNDLRQKGLDTDEISHVRSVLRSTIETGETEEEVVEQVTQEKTASHTADAQTEENAAQSEYYEAEYLSINALPLDEDVLRKLANAGIEKLYDLVLAHSEDRLDELVELTEAEKEHIAQTVTENVQYEE